LLVMNRDSKLVAKTGAIKFVQIPLCAWKFARLMYATVDGVIRKEEYFVISVTPNNLCNSNRNWSIRMHRFTLC
jgi:hypothetical protein